MPGQQMRSASDLLLFRGLASCDHCLGERTYDVN